MCIPTLKSRILGLSRDITHVRRNKRHSMELAGNEAKPKGRDERPTLAKGLRGPIILAYVEDLCTPNVFLLTTCPAPPAGDWAPKKSFAQEYMHHRPP